MPSSTTPTCSLIVTTYNQKERLGLVLDSILALSTKPLEVIIADDGSRQDTKALIEDYQKRFAPLLPLKHVWQEDLGFRASKVRNEAFKVAMGEYLIIIDGDMILDSEFVSDHLCFAKKGTLLQGSRIILNPTITQHILELHSQQSYKLAFTHGGLKAKRLYPLSLLIYATSCIKASFFDTHDFIKGVRSCNMSFYKSDCEAINGFSEEFVGWGREDSEFVARFLFNGGEMRRLKFSAIAYHLYHDENPRAMLESNHAIYLKTIEQKLTFAPMGLR